MKQGDPYDDDEPRESVSPVATTTRVTVPLDQYGRIAIKEGAGLKDTGLPRDGMGGVKLPGGEGRGFSEGRVPFATREDAEREVARVGGVWTRLPDKNDPLHPFNHTGARPTRLPYDPTDRRNVGCVESHTVRPPIEVCATLAYTYGVPSWLWNCLYEWARSGIEAPDSFFHVLRGRPGSEAILAYAARLREILRSGQR